MRILALLAILVSYPVCAQSSPLGDTRGYTVSAGLQGSSSSLGTVNRLDVSTSFAFNRNWSAAAGVPFYFVNPSASTTSVTGATGARGVGNIYAQIRFSTSTPAVNYVSTLTGTAPTGDREQGLSIGHATIDWTHSFARTFSRFTPFGEVGIANAVSDTMLFVRPYTATGFVAHFQGGATYRLHRWATASASAYAIEPGGTQRVTSRIVPSMQAGGTLQLQAGPGGGGPAGGPASGPRGPGGNRGVFETQGSSTGTTDIARDHGASAWVSFEPRPAIEFYAGYTRSTRFDLNVVFFGTRWQLHIPDWPRLSRTN